MNVAIPGDARVPQKEGEKIEKYNDLRRELQRPLESQNKSCPHCSWCSWDGN